MSHQDHVYGELTWSYSCDGSDQAEAERQAEQKLAMLKAEIRHEVAEELRAIAEHCYNMAAPSMDYAGYKALLDAADVISPREQQ